jgi:hypothetical protein
MTFYYATRTGDPLQKDEVKKIALGATRELYYWFPSLEGRTSKIQFHEQALEDMTGPFVVRAVNRYYSKLESKKDVKALCLNRVNEMSPDEIERLSAMIGVEVENQGQEKADDKQ